VAVGSLKLSCSITFLCWGGLDIRPWGWLGGWLPAWIG